MNIRRRITLGARPRPAQDVEPARDVEPAVTGLTVDQQLRAAALQAAATMVEPLSSNDLTHGDSIRRRALGLSDLADALIPYLRDGAR